MAKSERLREGYLAGRPLLDRFCKGLVEQLNELFRSNSISLAVPLECRVKSWESIESKMERLELGTRDVAEIRDLVGVRAIFLFRRDLEQARKLVADSLKVLGEEDTGARLDAVQFGYQSWHYQVEVPESWLAVPSLREFKGLGAELQLRTLAQHLWAAASHQLQYKVEATVPPPIRRTIHRVSALLETIDLEFERVLEERAAYLQAAPAARPAEVLNVDVVGEILDSQFPPQNRKPNEPYAELLEELQRSGVKTASDLRSLLEKHKARAIEADQEMVADRRKHRSYYGTSRDRIQQGVFFSHVGLARQVMSLAFGPNWRSKGRGKR